MDIRIEYKKKNLKRIKEYESNYYNEKKYDILRNQMISNLNRGQVSRPKEASIVKYKLVQDPITKKWK